MAELDKHDCKKAPAKESTFKPCAVIPVYNHPAVIEDTVAAIRIHGLDVVMVDDGSSEACKTKLEDIASKLDYVTLCRLDENQGKGGAVKAGLKKAYALGYSHGLQIDADGQHNSEDIPKFIAAAKKAPGTLISGAPVYDESVPKVRLYARYLTHVWVWINTLSFDIKDSMCGFRVYPLKASCKLIDKQYLGQRMDFDTEFMVKWHWSKQALAQIDTQICYPEDGVSHFRGWEDNVLISTMHTRLFFGMLRRLPSILFGRQVKQGAEDV